MIKAELAKQEVCPGLQIKKIFNGLKEILANTLNDESWRIARPPFKLLNKKEKDEIINAYCEE